MDVPQHSRQERKEAARLKREAGPDAHRSRSAIGAGKRGAERDESVAPKPGLRTRQVAAKLLAAVIEKQTSLDGLVDPEHGHPHFRQLEARDQALVKAILLTALRYRGTLTAEIAERLDRPLPGNATTLAHHLHVAAAQIRFLDVPNSAAVDLAVTACEADPRTKRFKGVVNAVLRRIGRELGGAAVETDPVLDCPDWLHDRLLAAYGKDRARAIAAAQGIPAAIDLTVKTDPDGWAQKLGGRVLMGHSIRLDPETSGSISSLEGFAEGEWWVQDVSAALPVTLFGDLSGKIAVDLCAAPGGKTAQLVGTGAEVTACEASKSRARRLAGNLDRLRIEPETLTGPFQAVLGERQFDAVLLDAPCSSTGTLRRHPDVGYTKSREEVARLASVQRTLLDDAANHVVSGGLLVFSNCSIDPIEGEELVAAFLNDRCDFERVAIEPDEIAGLENAVTRDGDLRTTPDMMAAIGGIDGFYAARLRKIG